MKKRKTRKRRRLTMREKTLTRSKKDKRAMKPEKIIFLEERRRAPPSFLMRMESRMERTHLEQQIRRRHQTRSLKSLREEQNRRRKRSPMNSVPTTKATRTDTQSSTTPQRTSRLRTGSLISLATIAPLSHLKTKTTQGSEAGPL